MRKEVLCLRVNREDYDYYAYQTTRLERDWVTSRMRAVFSALIAELKKKRGSEELKKEEREELVVRLEETLKVEESTALRLYRKVQTLEKELARALESVEQTKEELEKERVEREKCLKELDAVKKRPEALEKELQKKEVIVKELLELASLAIYCFESQLCEPSKVLGVLRNRLSKVGLEPIRLSDVLLNLVRKHPK